MNTPEHYDMKIQPIEYIMANGLGFCEGNIVKYVSRYKEKGGIYDLRKAKHYIELLIKDWADTYGDPEAQERMIAEQDRIDAELEQKKQDKIAANKEWADVMQRYKYEEKNVPRPCQLHGDDESDSVNSDFFKAQHSFTFTTPADRLSVEEYELFRKWLIKHNESK
jgi:hypothetical protein